jgi:hypothetical protein
MTTSTAGSAKGGVAEKAFSARMTTLLATACGLTAANVYYAQRETPAAAARKAAPIARRCCTNRPVRSSVR